MADKSEPKAVSPDEADSKYQRLGVKDFTFHDFRHCAITRWATAGVPTAAAMTAAGHKSVASHKKYQNLQKSHLKAGFLNSNLLQEKNRENEAAAS